MKKLTALILTLSMLLSMFAIPMGASAMTEDERKELLTATQSQYLDITKIDNAHVRGGYGYVAQNLFNKTFAVNMTFERNDNDPMFTRLNNTNFFTKLSAAGGANNPALAETNMAVKLYDLTNGINNGLLTLNSTENVTGKVGVKNPETELWSLEDASYDVHTYLYKGKTGTYKLGPVAEPNKDADGNWGDDVYSTTGGVVVIGAKDPDGNGISHRKNVTRDPYTYAYINTSTNETQSAATLKNVNASADYVNVLMQTYTIEGDAVLVPIKVSYTSGSVTKYVLENANNVDHMTKILAVPVNEDGTEHTTAQLDAARSSSYLTDEKRAELGLSDVTINDASFDTPDVIVPNLEVIGKETNRNLAQTTTTTDGVVKTKITKVNQVDTDFRVSDISIPVDRSKTISSIQITAFATPKSLAGIIASASSNRYYLPVKFDAYKGNDYKFYMFIGRQCEGRNNLFAISLSNKPIADDIAVIDAEIESAETIDELVAAKSAIAKMVAENDIVRESDFKSISAKATEIMNKEIAAAKTLEEYLKVDEDLDACAVALDVDVSELKATIAAKIADLSRVESLNNRYINVDMDFYHDFFATDNDFKNANWKVTSTAGAPNIFAYKGFASGMTQKFPATYSLAFKTSKIAETEAMSKNADGSYTFTIGNVPFKMGEIAENDGEIGANAWVPRSNMDLTAFDDASKLNTINADVFSSGRDSATYTIEKSGISDINIMSSTLGDNSTRFLKVYVKYEGEDPILYHHIIGRSNGDFSEKIMLWPVADYNKLMADDTKTVDMVDRTVGGWASGKADETYVALRDATKYYTYKKDRENYSAPVAMNTLTTVDLAKLSDNNENEEIYFPQASEKFVPSNYSSVPNSYVHTVAIPTDPSKKIETIKIESDIDHPDDISVASGGFYMRDTYSVAEAMLRVKYDGNDTITIGDTEYVMFIDVTRECTESAIFGMTLTNVKTVAEEIAELNEELAAIDTETITTEAIVAFKDKIAEIKAKNENVLDSDFNTEKLRLAEGKYIDTLKLKVNFPMSEKNGANSKLFMKDETWQTYKANKQVDETWVIGLDYVGIANASGKISYPTGKDTDTLGTSVFNNALLYKIDSTTVSGQWSSKYVNLTTKNNVLTWTLNGEEFVIDPTEKVIKAYKSIDTTNVEDPDLKARFESMKAPVLDVENGYYESIKLLTGVRADGDSLIVTINYETGDPQKITVPVEELKFEKFAAGTHDNQDEGYLLLQALTNWGNTNAGGILDFNVIPVTGLDTTRKVDSIKFVFDDYGSAAHIVSVFGVTAPVADILANADANNFASAEYAINTVDAILAENGYTAESLSATSAAKYNELKEATAAFLIEEITLAEGVVTVKYENTTSEDEKANLIVAQYNADESELISVKYQPVTFVKGETELTANVETDAVNKIKVFVWKDLVDFFPLTANIFGK